MSSVQQTPTAYALSEEPTVEETVYQKFHFSEYQPTFRIAKNIRVQDAKTIPTKKGGEATLCSVKFTLEEPIRDEHGNMIGTEYVFGDYTIWMNRNQTMEQFQDQIDRYRAYNERTNVTIAFSGIEDKSAFSKDGSKYTNAINVKALDVLSLSPLVEDHLTKLQQAAGEVPVEEDEDDHPF